MRGLILVLMSSVCYLAVILTFLVVTARYLVVTARYKVVTGGYCSLLVAAACYHSLLLVPTFSMNGSEMKILFKNSYAEQILSQYSISYCGPYLWNKIEISKNLTFSDSDSLQAFRRELKRFLLLIELNNLEILK